MANFSQMFGNMQPPGIMGGAMAGMRIPYEMAGADQELASKGIQNMSDLEKLKMQQESENPMNRAVNSLKQNEATTMNDPELLESQLQAKISGNLASILKDQDSQQASKNQFIAEMYSELKKREEAGLKPYDPMDKNSKDWWDGQVADAKKRGIPLPSVPDTQPDGSSKVIQGIMAKGASLVDSVAQTQKRELAKIPTDAQIQIHKSTDASREKMATEAADVKAYVAEIKANAEKDKAETKARNLANYKAVIISEIQAKRDPNPIILNLAADEAFTVAVDKTALGIKEMLATMDSSTQDKAGELKKKWKAGWINDNFNLKVNPETMKPTESPSTSEAPKTSGYTPSIKSRIQAVADANKTTFEAAEAALKKAGKL